MARNADDATPMGATERSTGEYQMSLHRVDRANVGAHGAGLLKGAALGVLLTVAAGACNDPLNVPDPNSIQGEDLESPAAVPSLVSGTLKNMNEMIGETAAIYATASDEVQWIGSRDAWESLSQGFVDDPVNEFSDAAFPDVTDARFMADRAVAQAEEFQGELSDPADRVRAYLFGAVVYATIADIYDDFVLPEDPREAADPVGTDGMIALYDQAVGWLDSAESAARELGEPEMVTRAIAYRARVRHARAVWEKLNPPGSAPSDPLISDGQMADDASAVLQRVGTANDWRWEAVFSNQSAANNLAFQINERGELQYGPEYVVPVEGTEQQVEEIVIADPVTGEPSPVFERRIGDFEAGGQFSPLDITSAREMHLLLAEHALAEADTAGFRTHVNHVRTIAEQEAYEAGDAPAMEMLRHSRRVHLFLMNRRLADMYRFGATSERWLSQSPAATEPGTFFPIAITEVRSNPNVDGG